MTNNIPKIEIKEGIYNDTEVGIIHIFEDAIVNLTNLKLKPSFNSKNELIDSTINFLEEILNLLLADNSHFLKEKSNPQTIAFPIDRLQSLLAQLITNIDNLSPLPEEVNNHTENFSNSIATIKDGLNPILIPPKMYQKFQELLSLTQTHNTEALNSTLSENDNDNEAIDFESKKGAILRILSINTTKDFVWIFSKKEIKELTTSINKIMNDLQEYIKECINDPKFDKISEAFKDFKRFRNLFTQLEQLKSIPEIPSSINELYVPMQHFRVSFSSLENNHNRDNILNNYFNVLKALREKLSELLNSFKDLPFDLISLEKNLNYSIILSRTDADTIIRIMSCYLPDEFPEKDAKIAELKSLLSENLDILKLLECSVIIIKDCQNTLGSFNNVQNDNYEFLIEYVLPDFESCINSSRFFKNLVENIDSLNDLLHRYNLYFNAERITSYNRAC